MQNSPRHLLERKKSPERKHRNTEKSKLANIAPEHNLHRVVITIVKKQGNHFLRAGRHLNASGSRGWPRGTHTVSHLSSRVSQFQVRRSSTWKPRKSMFSGWKFPDKTFSLMLGFYDLKLATSGPFLASFTWIPGQTIGCSALGQTVGPAVNAELGSSSPWGENRVNPRTSSLSGCEVTAHFLFSAAQVFLGQEEGLWTWGWHFMQQMHEGLALCTGSVAEPCACPSSPAS